MPHDALENKLPHPKKVLHMVKVFRVGGLENVIKNLAINSSQDIIPEILVLQIGGQFSHEVEEKNINVTILNSYSRKLSSGQILKDVSLAIKKIKPDVIHCHDQASWFYGTIAGRLHGIKKILFTKHGYVEELSWKTIILSQFMSLLSKKIIAVSPKVKQNISRNLKIKKNIDIIYNGVDTQCFSEPTDRRLAKKLVGVDEHAFVVGTVTRFYSIKNIEMQIDMVERLAKVVNNFLYIIVAPLTRAGERYKKDVEDRGLSEYVWFTGFRDDIPQLLQAMDVFVLSSLSEGTSVSLLEAMASGCIPVVSATGGTPDIIKDGQNGFLFSISNLNEMCDKIMSCRKNAQDIERIRVKALQTASRYNVQRMIESYETLYKLKK